jgi:hypothetical protein
MSHAKDSFRLVVYHHQLDPHIFREILADKLNLNRADAMRLVSHAPGIIPFSLTHRRATRLARTLASVGVQVGVWRDDQLPDLRELCQVHKVACQAEGLATFGMRCEPLHWVPWSHIELISVGEFPRETKEICQFGPTWLSVSAGAVRSIVIGYHRTGTHVRKEPAKALPVLWVVRRRPIQAICMQQDQVNYEYLLDRRRSSARANFRLLIDDLTRFAPNATITPATRSFLRYARPGEHFFASTHQFRHYTVWQLMIRWRDRSCADSSWRPPEA